MKKVTKECTVYYTIQHRRTHLSEWGKPDGKLIKQPAQCWAFSSFDHFAKAFNPHHGKGNNWRPRRPAAAADNWSLQSETGCAGWTKKSYADVALREVINLSRLGEYDSSGPYRERMQAVRHEFRIVRCFTHTSYETI